MDAKTAFLDRYVRPCRRDQFGFPDNLTGFFEKSDQDVVSPSTKWNDLVRLLQSTLGYIEFKWAKPKLGCGSMTQFVESDMNYSAKILDDLTSLHRSSLVLCKYTPSPAMLAETSSCNKLSVHQTERPIALV